MPPEVTTIDQIVGTNGSPDSKDPSKWGFRFGFNKGYF